METRKPRCARCRLHEDLCLCAEIPKLSTRTRLVLLMHAQEDRKPSNTGKLAHFCLPNSEIRLRGEIGKPLSLEGLFDPNHETWLLHLSEESECITPELVAGLSKPVNLLVPDGTWSQASRLGAKLARTEKGLRHVYLRSDAPSEYRLRTEHHEDGMSTFEAIARCFGLLEGPQIRADMEHIFRKVIGRELWTRGKIPAHEVYGGLPKKRTAQ